MDNDELFLKEFETLRNEICVRVVILHQIINLAVVLLFVFIVLMIGLYSTGVKLEIIKFSLLAVPVIFSFLTFNYQANQMTLEAIAKYENSVTAVSTWENFYAKYKLSNKLTSFLKVLPLLVPQFFSLIAIIYLGMVANAELFFWIDSVLFLLSIINFKYKLKY